MVICECTTHRNELNSNPTKMKTNFYHSNIHARTQLARLNKRHIFLASLTGVTFSNTGLNDLNNTSGIRVENLIIY